jgi:glycosyltransferase involved in cell wall biosynthesis
LPGVSWLIPVRNGCEWLTEAVLSALAESGSDDEVVVVDDGSDESVRSLLPEDDRVVLVQQGPEGIVSALERGRKRCRHEWIARLDADDAALPGRVAAQTRFLMDHPNVAVVGGRAQMNSVLGKLTDGMQRYLDWVNGIEDWHAELLVESPLFHPAVMMRASVIEQLGGYREGDLPEDYDLWLRVVSAGHQIAAVSQDVVRLRDHPARLTRTDSRYRRLAFQALKMEFLDRGPLSNPKRVAVWGAGKTGRSWLRWLKTAGHDVPVVFDPFQGTERQGVPIRPPNELAELRLDHLIVAVGVAGARQTIREQISRLRPSWREGRDWWAVC